MSPTILLLALPVAVVAAVRGIWSPCGLSMLSSLTPMTEAGRGNRFNVTAAWFVVGGLVGGLSLGVLASIAAAGVATLDIPSTALAAAAAVVAVVDVTLDVGATSSQSNHTSARSIRTRFSNPALAPVGVTMLIAPPSRAPPKRSALPPR